MKHTKFLYLICLFLALCLLFAGCSRRECTPAEALAAMCDTEKPLPAGRTLIASAPEGSDRHLSDLLVATFFGNGSLPPEWDLVSDAACFLSYTQPCELSVLLCKSADAADAVARMCLRRLDKLRAQHAQDGANAHYFENACVTVRGRWVILCVSSDPSAALRAFKKAL